MQEKIPVFYSDAVRLKALHDKLDVNWAVIAKRLGRSEDWVYKVLKGSSKITGGPRLKLAEYEREAGITPPVSYSGHGAQGGVMKDVPTTVIPPDDAALLALLAHIQEDPEFLRELHVVAQLTLKLSSMETELKHFAEIAPKVEARLANIQAELKGKP